MVENPLHKLRENKEYQKFKQKVEEYSLKSTLDGNYYLFASDYAKNFLNSEKASPSSYSYMSDLIEGWDEDIQIPYEIGKMIEDFVNNPNYFIGIHRTPIYQDQEHIREDDVLNSIFNNGLMNYGDLSSGIHSKEIIPVNKTVSPIDDMLTALIYLKSSYKGSKGGVLVAIPSIYVDKEGNVIPGHEKDVYKDANYCYAIKPDFLLGYVACNDNKIEYYSQKEFDKKIQMKQDISK